MATAAEDHHFDLGHAGVFTCSRPRSAQKLASLTFQVALNQRAVPVVFFNAGWPSRSTVYRTVALVDVMFDTLVTVALAPFASAEDAWASITDANFVPSCSNAIFVFAEVLPLKNFSQFTVIVFVAVVLLTWLVRLAHAGAPTDPASKNIVTTIPVIGFAAIRT